MFTQFIEECSFVSDRHACLEFFDECVQKVLEVATLAGGGVLFEGVSLSGHVLQVDVEKPEEVRLMDVDESHGGEHTVFIMPPEVPQEADGSDCPALYRWVAASHLRGFLCSSKPTLPPAATRPSPR